MAESRTLDLDLLVPEERALTLTVGGERRAFPVAGSVSLLQMVAMLRAERRLRQALDTGDDSDEIEASAEAALDLLTLIVRERTPDAPALDVDVRQLLLTFRYLAGDDSVADAVAHVLTDGEPAQTADELERESRDPLASMKPSPEPSSGSESSEDGTPNGGERAAGELSEPSSLSPETS